MRITYALLIFLFSLVSPSAALASTPALTRADVEAWLDGLLPYALQYGDVAGGVVVVVKDGEVLLQKGYGYADVASKRLVDPQRTLLRAGSVAKLVSDTAVMQLVEQGKLDLDADIQTYLDFKIPDAFGKPVTMRNLITHSGGFEELVRGLMNSARTHELR
jgi:CubicO group peptidase (beta-lactamase class C family)